MILVIVVSWLYSHSTIVSVVRESKNVVKTLSSINPDSKAAVILDLSLSNDLKDRRIQRALLKSEDHEEREERRSKGVREGTVT